MTSQAQIVRVLQVVDTREYELVETPRGERYTPIPGSGNERECDRCGRMHEVHAHVELSDGTTAIVGTGCMGAADMTKEARRLASRARKERAEAAEEAHEESTANAVRDALANLPEPPTAILSKHADGERDVYTVGDASASIWPVAWRPESESRQSAINTAIRAWRENRLEELGFDHHAQYIASRRGVRV